MKIWEKAKNEDIKRIKLAYKEKLAEVERNWINFKNTGVCEKICCDDCPLQGKMCVEMSKEVKREEVNKEVKE